MALISMSDEAVAQAMNWLESNAPEYVEEAIKELFNALDQHNQLSNLQSTLNSQFSGLVDDLTDIFPMEDASEEDQKNITTRVINIAKTNDLIQSISPE